MVGVLEVTWCVSCFLAVFGGSSGFNISCLTKVCVVHGDRYGVGPSGEVYVS